MTWIALAADYRIGRISTGQYLPEEELWRVIFAERQLRRGVLAVTGTPLWTPAGTAAMI